MTDVQLESVRDTFECAHLLAVSARLAFDGYAKRDDQQTEAVRDLLDRLETEVGDGLIALRRLGPAADEEPEDVTG